MKVSSYIAKVLHLNGVEFVFELSGGMITNILDEIYKERNIKIISMHHEQGASFAVDAYSRVAKGRRCAVALATSGPGATNLITGIGSCYFDSVPAIFITGQVNQHEQRRERNIRQLGFQETDIVEMTKHITKKSYKVESCEEIPKVFEEVFQIIYEGRPGPVLIDIPMNIQIQKSEKLFPKEFEFQYYNIQSEELNANIVELYSKIKEAKKPVILCGRGVVVSESEDKLLVWAEKMNIPIAYSLLGIGSIYHAHPLCIGMIGTYGNRWTNIAIGESDLLIVLGSRLDIRQTGADVNFFSANRVIFHVDIDSNEINNRIKNCIPIVSDISFFLDSVISNFPKDLKSKDSSWIDTIKNLKTNWSDLTELKDIEGINPNLFFKQLSENSEAASIFVADVGSHQMWAAQSIRLLHNQKFITSGGMGAMGYALPAAIGAYFASKLPVVSISGDGGIQLNIQELETISFHRLPIKIIVINNKSLGMIRQFQDSYFEGRHQSTVWGYSAPDFISIANAYKIRSYKISMESDIEVGLFKMWEHKDEPFLLEVQISPNTNVYPKIAFGRPINQMEPMINALEMEGT